MNAFSKLLLTTTAPLLNVACNTRAAIFLQSRKIFYMLEPTWQQWLLENLRGSSLLKVLNSNYLEPAISMDNSSSHQKCTKAKMDPYHDTCYNQNNATAICDISFNSASNYNMLYQQSGTFVDKTHSKTNVHVAGTKHGNFIDKPTYKAMRKWKQLGKEKPISNTEDCFLMRVLSFNILAQNLLEDHSYLYLHHNKKALMWKIRKPLVIQEIIEAEANVICLQEMQEDHLLDFVIPFKQLGYDYLYKKRTNDKKDGLLLLYRSDQFTLLDYAKVELYQSGVELLNRDNVGIIAKFSLKDSPETQFVIATTHLLYNPKRNDVRLAQIQLLLAEIERIAFVENSTKDKAKYLPIILTGDFNLEPFTAVYKFLTEGFFEYHGKDRNLEPSPYRSLSSLIPSRLCVTDNCQHFNILTQRLRREGTGRVMLENSESPPQKQGEKMPTPCSTKVLQQNNVIDTGHAQTIEIIEGHSAKFASGTLTHPFNLRSVYTHTSAHGEKKATTHQQEWVMVDYIFYSNIQLIEKYTLLTVSQCNTLRRIPNFVVGSDHLSIGATFKLKKNLKKKSPL